MPAKQRIKRTFSRAALTYDNVSSVQRDAAAALVSLLRRHVRRQFESILDVGAGTGVVTEKLLCFYPQAQYTLNDISPEMLKIAAKKFQGLSHITYKPGDAERMIFEPHDLTIANLSLHWLTHLETSIEQLWDRTKIFCFSIPCKKSFLEWEKLHQELNLPSPLLTLPDPQQLSTRLQALKPKKFVVERKRFTLTLESPGACLRYFQALGANATSIPWTISAIRKILHLPQTPFMLSYDILFCLLVKS